MAEAEPEVEIVEDQVVRTDDTPVEVSDKTDDTKIVTAEEGVDELKRRLEAETKAKLEAEAKARQATAEVRQAKTEVEDSQLREITGAIDVVKRNLDIAKSNYKAARTANDMDAEVEAQETIARSQAELIQLEAGKAAREARAKLPKPEPQAGDPVEALAGILTPKSAAWVRSHPEVARNADLYQDMLAAHRMALKKHVLESDGYFKSVEDAMGFSPTTIEVRTEPTAENPMSSASRPVAPAAAPVSRNGAGPGAPRPGTTRLSREEAEIALSSYADLAKEKGPQAAYQAYAKAKDDLKKAGRLN